MVRRLLTEIKHLGFTGCYTHLARFVSSWRRDRESKEVRAKPTPSGLLAQDPVTGRQISPQMAAMLCIKPRKQLTPRQAAAV